MEKFKSYLKWFFESFIWLAILLLVVDIVTKAVIVANRDYINSLPNQRIDLIPGFLGIAYTINWNAAFGLGTTSEIANRVLYIVIATLACAGLVFVYVKYYKKLNKIYKACLMLMLVGALGNLIDRSFYTGSIQGYPKSQPGVVDWIDFYGIWPYVFNIADSAIVIGTILLIIWLIVEEVRDSKKRNSVQLKKDVVEAKIEAQKAEAQEVKPVEEVKPIEEVKEVEPVKEVEEPATTKKPTKSKQKATK